jgi:uncharacterized protein (TIGR03083 family)
VTRDPRTLARAERLDLADLLDTLTPAQWETTSLCPEWTVRQVAVHTVSYDDLGYVALGATILKGRLGTGSANDRRIAAYDDLDYGQVAALVREHADPRGLTAGFGGLIALTDTTIHHQDIRRPLGLHRTIPTERLLPVLDFAMTAPTLPARRNVRRLSLVATDVDWRHGDEGPEVTGPGEALLMAAAGRTAALRELSGPGLDELSSRLG